MQRNTLQRRIILSAVRDTDSHPTAADVYSAVCESYPGISRATVYRVLGQLAEENEIQRLHLTDGIDRFDHTLGEHAHFICTSCGKVCDLPLDCVPLSSAGGYVIESMSVSASGLCPVCAAKSGDTAAGD